MLKNLLGSRKMSNVFEIHQVVFGTYADDIRSIGWQGFIGHEISFQSYPK